MKAIDNRDVERAKFEAGLHDKKLQGVRSSSEEIDASPEKNALMEKHLAARKAEKMREAKAQNG